MASEYTATPSDLGMDYEDLHITTADGVKVQQHAPSFLSIACWLALPLPHAFLCGAAATDQLLAGEAEGRLPGQAHPHLLLGQRGKCVAHLICLHLIVKMHTNSPSDEELRVQQTDISHRLEKVRKTFYHGVGCNVLLVSYRVRPTSVHLRSALAR